MKSASEVDALIKQYKAEINAGNMTLSEAIFKTGRDCVGWPYVFGARGGLTTKDGVQVRKFDCRGFTYWCALQFGININGAGCTSQWNDDSNWKAKGDIADIPDDILVCLFYRKQDEPKKMAHTGFGFKGQTVECSSGVQYFAKRKAKWEYWAVPKGIDGEVPDYKPTLRRGDKGEYVTLLQTELVQKGYDIGKCGIDGSFGAATEKAVREFQRNSGLAVDGVVGKNTWAALEQTTTTLYTVTIPHLTASAADALCTQYPGATKTEDRGGVYGKPDRYPDQGLCHCRYSDHGVYCPDG